MKTRLIVLLLVTLFVFVKQADCDDLSQARSLFYKGNAYYSEEKFKQATAQYEEVLRLSFDSGPLYYNLGNAYFKSGSLGKAILNYQRAKRLIPRDADLKANLNYAHSLIEGGIVSPERKWLSRLFFTLVDSFSLDRITLISTILYLVLISILIFIIVAKRLRRIFTYLGGLTLILLVICLCIFSVQFHKTIIQKNAVVIVESSFSKFEPFDDATTFFTLNEGESVVIIASKENWIKVRRIDAKQGWIKNSDIELL